MSVAIWDYIFVGGGLAGSVVSSRLSQSLPQANILIIEAGPNANDDPNILYRNTTMSEEYFWRVPTTPQARLNGRSIQIPVGHALGGGTVVNGANWVRGDSIDYDVWADTVGDARWSYNSQLPYMKKTESFHPANRNPNQHGTEGNVFVQTTTSTNRKFPLRETVRQSWNSLIGFPTRPDLDGNGGNPIGVADLAENRANGRRQVASMVYPLDRVTVVAGELVQNVLITTTAGQAPKATGVKLANGTEFKGRNTIISAGALRTPQLLMLSGIGPRDQLQKFGIPVKLDAPAVGNNLIDHISVTTKWKIRDPSKGYAPGSGNPLFDDERFGWGFPSDFMVSGGVEWSGLMRSIAIDEGATPNPLTHPMLRKPGRTFLEYVLQYSGADDGSVITLQSCLFMPHSRGQVTLGSKSIQDFPIVNPNYLRSLTDRFVLRRGVRNLWRFANSTLTPMARDILDGEIVPDGQQLLRGDMTDDEINARMAANVRSVYHPQGTAAMGTVVDTKLKVKGVNNLYIVDASVIPVPIAAHLQVAVYALAEQAAEILAKI